MIDLRRVSFIDASGMNGLHVVFPLWVEFVGYLCTVEKERDFI